MPFVVHKIQPCGPHSGRENTRYRIIFSDTRRGWAFGIGLFSAIVLSVLAVSTGHVRA